MTKIVLTKTTSAIFLAIVLVAGTIALSPTSFMVGTVQATSDHEKDYDKNDKKSYTKVKDESSDHEKDYDKKSYYKDESKEYLSYGKDNSYYKSKDSSNVFVKKIKCNNINVNLNGFNGLKLNALPTSLNALTTNEAQAVDVGEKGASSSGSGSGSDGSRSSGHNTDSRFVCKNNNNFNVNDGGTTTPTEPPTVDNNVYVVWEDESNGGDTDIFFTVSNDNGQTFDPPTDLSNNAGNSFNQQMIVSGNNVYVVWQDESNGGDIDIFFTVSNDNGQTFDPPTDLSNNADFSEAQQMIVSGNNVYVVWRDESNGGDTDILFAVSNDNGQTFDPPTDLSNNAAGSSGQQMIASGNNVYVVWQDESNGGDRDIFFTVSNDNGQTFDPPTDLSNNAGDSDRQQMIASGSNVYVVWVDGSNGGDEDIFFTVSNDNGQTFDPPTDLSNNAGRSFNQQMIVSGNNVYVVWQDESNGGDNDIFFTASNDNGQTFDPPTDLSNNADISFNQQMIISGNNVYVVWEDDSNGGDRDIFFTVSNDNGQTFDPPTDLSNNGGFSETQQMIISGNNVYVVWEDDSNGGDRDIFFTVSNDNGQTFDPPTDLSNNAGNSFGQQMIASGNNVYVVWIDDSNGGDDDIFFTASNDNGQTFDPPTDLSNNADGSGRQQMIVSGNNVYVVWVNSGDNDDIFFTVSNDNGQTFDPPTDLSNNAGNSDREQMIVQ